MARRVCRGAWNRDETPKDQAPRRGIARIRELFGDEAATVARQHIISDLKEEGWNQKDHPFPRDEDHYVKMGLY